MLDLEKAHPVLIITLASLRPGAELLELDEAGEARIREEIAKYHSDDDMRTICKDLVGFAVFLFAVKDCRQAARRLFALASIAARALMDGTEALVRETERDLDQQRAARERLLDQDLARAKESPVAGTKWWQVR